jgi:hypothetical protein
MDVLVAKTIKRQSEADKKEPVRCVKTGTVYGSCGDAANLLSEESISVCQIRIQAVCRGKQKTAGGIQWEYA